jgi:hypothetical protein
MHRRNRRNVAIGEASFHRPPIEEPVSPHFHRAMYLSLKSLFRPGRVGKPEPDLPLADAGQPARDRCRPRRAHQTPSKRLKRGAAAALDFTALSPFR